MPEIVRADRSGGRADRSDHEPDVVVRGRECEDGAARYRRALDVILDDAEPTIGVDQPSHEAA